MDGLTIKEYRDETNSVQGTEVYPIINIINQTRAQVCRSGESQCARTHTHTHIHTYKQMLRHILANSTLTCTCALKPLPDDAPAVSESPEVRITLTQITSPLYTIILSHITLL